MKYKRSKFLGFVLSLAMLIGVLPVIAEGAEPTLNITISEMSNGTVTADKATAKGGDVVTLTISPDTYFELAYITVKDNNDTAIVLSGTGNTRTFTMPRNNVTVKATFKGKTFNLTISDTITGGTVKATGDGVSTTDNTTTANYGSEVTLTVTPDAGYDFDSVTAVKKTDNAPVSLTKTSDTSYKFTMPLDDVTVSATFEGRSVSATLNMSGNEGTSSKVTMLDESYNEIAEPLNKTAGEKFILCVVKDEDYNFNVTFSTGVNASGYVKEFSVEEYQAYIDYAKKNNISVPSNTYLFWITLPGSDDGSVKIIVTFSKLQTFTILYQPAGSTNSVWCRFGLMENGTENFYTTAMKSDAAMGDGTAAWSLKVSTAFNPTKAAFLTAASSLTQEQAETSLNSAAMTDITVLGTAPTQDSDWTSIADNGKFCVIGGNTKTFIVAFVSEASAMSAYNSNSADVDAAQTTGGVTYRVAVCNTDDSGNITTVGTVKVPENTYTKNGYDFAGWRGFEGTAPNRTEKIYNAGDSISVSENTTLNAVWNLKNPSITLNLNGGTGGSNVTSVVYGNLLTISENPTKKGYSFDGWTASETVTEDGTLFAKGSPFDLSTKITADLKLTAQWKHVHYYTAFRVSLFSSLTEYQKYDSAVHIAVCGCGKIELAAHEFDSSGKCSCGYTKSVPEKVTLETSYGQWSNGTYSEKMQGLPETVGYNQEVSISAPSAWGNLQFSKWQYSTDNATWEDLTAYEIASFLIPASMKVRALYVNPITKPQVDLSARPYENQTVVDGKTYQMDNMLFHMNYKLPDGYSFVDAGIRLGDNSGISYYELKERTYTTDNGGKAMMVGVAAVMNFLGNATTVELSTTDTYYADRENSVLDEMSAETLSKYMYESKPINVEKYKPIYWEAKAVTKGMSGSMETLPPLRFAQKNNKNHYIYGIAYLRYKKPNGTSETIYTPALPATVNNIPSNTVTKKGK